MFLTSEPTPTTSINIPVLRPYQIGALDQIAYQVKEGIRSILCVCPTGGGKTTIAAELIRRTVLGGGRAIFMAHRAELIDQAKGRLVTFGLKPGVIQAGHQSSMRPVQVASVQTLNNRHYPATDLLIVDEAHHAMSNTFKRAIDHYLGIGATVVGLSATPFRLDGKELGDLFQALVNPVGITDLIHQGHLVKPRYIAPDKLDLTGIKTNQANGVRDYNGDEMYQQIFNKKEVFAGVIENYRTYANDSKAIVFNCNVEHSLKMVDVFTAAGYTSAHVDGSMDRFRRKKILNDFAAGRIQILNNVYLLTEGYDLPGIETVILNKFTKSKCMYIQMVGRGLRPAGDKVHCMVLDQGGNVWEHGRVDTNEDYSLDPAEKKEKKTLGASPVKMCPSCQYIQAASAKTCGDCGYEWPVQDRINKKETEFREVTEADLAQTGSRKPQLPPELRYKPFDEMTLHELNIVRETQKHKDLWVLYKLKDRVIDSPRQWDMLETLINQYRDMRGYDPNWTKHMLHILARQ